MFVSVNQIKETTGITVSLATVRLAQLMIETWVGRSEVEIEESSDFALLQRATIFQAVYLGDNGELLLEQAAVKSVVQNEATSVFDTDMFAPYMSPWAIRACRKLSWLGTRSVQTGPLFETMPARDRWRYW